MFCLVYLSGMANITSIIKNNVNSYRLLSDKDPKFIKAVSRFSAALDSEQRLQAKLCSQSFDHFRAKLDLLGRANQNSARFPLYTHTCTHIEIGRQVVFKFKLNMN